MRKIEKYTVAHAVYVENIAATQYKALLEDEVNKLIADGWQPYGPLVSSNQGETVVFLQPMVKYRDEARVGVGEGVSRQVEEGYFG